VTGINLDFAIDTQKGDTLDVVAAYYDLASGKVSLLG
jgi:hypothetical protein